MRIVHPHRPPQRQRDEADLLPVAGDGVELAGDHLLEALERWRGAFEDAHPADVHRGCWAPRCAETRRPAGSSTPCRLLLQDLRQDSVDRAVDRHSGVTRLDLDLAGGGIKTGPPRRRSHRCASRSPLRAPPADRGARRSSRKAAQQSPSAHRLENTPGTPQVAQARHRAHRPQHGPADAQRLEHRRAEHHERAHERPDCGPPARARALRRGSARSPPRGARSARPAAAALLEPTRRSLGAIDVQDDPGRRGARAAATQPSRSTASEASPAMNPGTSRTGGAAAVRLGRAKSRSAARRASSSPYRISPRKGSSSASPRARGDGIAGKIRAPAPQSGTVCTGAWLTLDNLHELVHLRPAACRSSCSMPSAATRSRKPRRRRPRASSRGYRASAETPAHPTTEVTQR